MFLAVKLLGFDGSRRLPVLQCSSLTLAMGSGSELTRALCSCKVVYILVPCTSMTDDADLYTL